MIHLKVDDELAHDRMLSLQQYLDQICLSPVLRYSPELECFLTKPGDDLLKKEKPPRAFAPAHKFISDKYEPLHLCDMQYPGGKVNIMMDTKMRGVTHEISHKVDQLITNEKEASYICKEIHSIQERLGKLYQNLGSICSKVSNIYKDLDQKVKFPNIAKLSSMYSGLKDFMREHHRMVAKESEVFGDNIRAMFDFSVRELEGITSVDHFLT